MLKVYVCQYPPLFNIFHIYHLILMLIQNEHNTHTLYAKYIVSYHHPLRTVPGNKFNLDKNKESQATLCAPERYCKAINFFSVRCASRGAFLYNRKSRGISYYTKKGAFWLPQFLQFYYASSFFLCLARFANEYTASTSARITRSAASTA